jgi:predicted alpha/beta superfamily hydrolase
MNSSIRHTILFYTSLLICFVGLSQEIPNPSCGQIVHLEKFASQYVSSRNVDIWLPPSYDGSKAFEVLYMHDGQMLFDSTMTWNKQSWKIDENLCLMQYNVIVVGIWNAGSERHMDYFPQQPFENMSAEEQDLISGQLIEAGRSKGQFKPNSDNYLKFIVKELKPYIDSTFNVSKKMESTFIAGSSMGGLISLYAICEYPEVFGGAACLSTHWPGTFTVDNNPFPKAMQNYLIKTLPSPKNHKIYFDLGNQTLDALYPPIQKKVDKIMKRKHYKMGKSWLNQFFLGDDHSEKSWAKRLYVPFNYFFLKEIHVLISK